MKIGALTGMPCRFASSTCPISWTNMRSTNPTANFQPQNSVYAATETSIVAEVVMTLILAIAKKMNLNLRSSAPSTTNGVASLRRRRKRGSCLTGSGGS